MESHRLSWVQWGLSFVAVGGAVFFVLMQLHPSLLLTNTTPAGGDMGAHVWAPAYLRDHLLPHGRLAGWTPDWYAGFPALAFYFPLPSLLIVILDLVLPYNIAFKLVSVSGLVTLPIAAWGFGRLSRMRFPGPECLAVATVPFLFDRGFTIYGGNIPSTLAGEFAFSISLSVALVFLGLVARGLDDGKHRALAAALLAITGLCHVVPAFFALAGMLAMLLFRLDRQRLRWFFPVGIVAALLSAFWTLPFMARIAYTNDMGWEKLTNYSKLLLQPEHTPMFSVVGTRVSVLPVMAAVGALLSIIRRRRTGSSLVVLTALSAAGVRYCPDGRLWNARLLPFWFLCLYMLAGVAIAEGVRLAADVYESIAARRAARGAADPVAVGTDAPTDGAAIDAAVPEPDDLLDEGVPVHTLVPAEMARPPRHIGHSFPELVAPLAALMAALVFVSVPLGALPNWLGGKAPAERSFIPDWVRWNYTGYERKASYPEYADLIEKMGALGRERGCGRAMWEYESQLDRLGTPMALMLLPYWTKGCIGSMEGLFFESSATTPYHFLNQSELSQGPSRAQRDLPYRSLDLDNGIAHLQMMGVRYYMALTDQAKAAAAVHPQLEHLGSSGPWPVNYPEGTRDVTWEIYEVADSALVTPLAFQPVVMEGVAKGGDEWLEAAIGFYQDQSRWDVFLAASGPDTWLRVEGADATPPRLSITPTKVTNIRTADNRISFDVAKPGVPVLVKTSYFPNWRADGADGPWRVTPNLMVVIPTSSHVELRYASTPVDIGSWLLTLLGLAGLVWLARRPALVFGGAPPARGAGDREPRDPQPDPPGAAMAEPVLVGTGDEPS